MGLQAYHTINPAEIKDWFSTVLSSAIKWRGNQGQTRCPFHDDRNPSFSVNAEKGTWICHAGCGSGGINDFAKRLMVESPFKKSNSSLAKRREVVASYQYLSEDGEVLYRVCRTFPKGFYQQRPDGKGGWINKMQGVRRVPYNLPEILKMDKDSEVVFVVEGEKDANTLSALGLKATTKEGGAGGWPKDVGYNRCFEGANVVILPDNDKTGHEHAQEVALALHPIAQTVKVLPLPGLTEKGDVSDWVAIGHSKDELLALVEATPYWNPASAELTVIEGGTGQVISGKFSPTVREKYFDGGTFVPKLLAEDVLTEESLFSDGHTLWVYKNGVYLPQGRQVVERSSISLLDTEYRRARVEEVAYYIEKMRVADTSLVNPDDRVINLRNGLLDWQSGELRPHTPERLSTIQVPVVYDPTAKADKVLDFIEEVLPHDCIDLVFEIFGYCLLPTAKFERAFLLTGTGGNGKSKLIDLLNSFIGRQNVANISFQDLCEHRFKLAGLQGKLINTCADLPAKAIQDISTFKMIVSGDYVNAERKGQDPFEFRPFARLIFSANQLPQVNDVSQAFYRRITVIPFNNRFEHGKNADAGLIDKLVTPEELSGLLNLALAGLKQLFQKGNFSQNQSSQEALAQYRRESDSVLAFVEDKCVVEDYAVCGKARLYDEYGDWCDDEGYTSLGRNKFYRRVQELQPKVHEIKERSGPRLWSGIGLRP